MDAFNQFKWCLPHCFREALLSCYFCVGDRIYDTEKAYSGEWGEALKKIKWIISIKYPEKDNLKIEDQNYSRVFFDNWNSKVIFNMDEIGQDTKIMYETTQGRLYKFLQTNDIVYIKSDTNTSVPTIMRSNFHVFDPLKPNFIKFGKTIKSEEEKEYNIIKKEEQKKRIDVIKKNIDSSTLFTNHFITAIDETNMLHTSKIKSIEKELKDFNKYQYTPKEIGLTDFEYIATNRIIHYEIVNSTVDLIEDKIKEAVYAQSNNSEKKQFRITNHGILF